MTKPKNRRVVTAYGDVERAAMAALLIREGDGAPPDIDAVIEDLLNAFRCIGLILDGSLECEIWHELGDARLGAKQKAVALERCAGAPDPVSAAQAQREIVPLVNAALHHRWGSRWRRESRNTEPRLRHLDWRGLTEPEQTEFRQMLLSAASYQRQFAPKRGRPRLGFLDDALLAVADVFLRHGGDTVRHWSDLAYGVETRFIRFCALALDPLASVLVHDGVPAAEVRDLSFLIEPAMAERGLRALLTRNGGASAPGLADIAVMLKLLANPTAQST